MNEEIVQCTSATLAIGLCTHELGLNCVAKALQTELALKPQPIEG